jgi:hypothetical protein
MIYVEWLRVRNLLRLVAIVLGILLVLAIVLRISVSRYMSPQTWIHESMAHPGVHVTNTTLPDGTKRTILDEPTQSKHVVIDDRGYSGTHIVVTEPSSQAHHENTNLNVGSVQVIESKHGTVTTTIIDTNSAVPMIYYMALADLVALIVATILAAPFARETDGHLEIALTKPISRVRYALGAIGVDIAGIIAASILTVLTFYICQLLFESPRLDFTGINARAIAMGIVCPLAWYAGLCAATTWLNRGWIAVLAFAWPVVGLLSVLTLVHPINVVALFVRDVAWVLSRLDPLSYVSWAGPAEIRYTGDTNFGFRLSMQFFFLIVYSALAIFKWRRVEA